MLSTRVVRLRANSTLAPVPLSVFSILGKPGVAVKAELPSDSTIHLSNASLVSPLTGLDVLNTNAVASVRGPAGFIFAGPHPPAILPVSGPWKVLPSYLLAWTAEKTGNEITGYGEMVLSAPGGVFRVDVPDGQSLVADPNVIVAYTGDEPAITYREGRLDVLGAWLTWTANATRDTFEWLRKATVASYTYFVTAYHKLSQLAGPTSVTQAQIPLPRAQASQISELAPVQSEVSDTAPLQKPLHSRDQIIELPKKPKPTELETRAREYLAIARRWTTAVYRKSSDALYYGTHPQKALFAGPCVVLFKGSSAGAGRTRLGK